MLWFFDFYDALLFFFSAQVLVSKNSRAQKCGQLFSRLMGLWHNRRKQCTFPTMKGEACTVSSVVSSSLTILSNSMVV